MSASGGMEETQEASSQRVIITSEKMLLGLDPYPESTKWGVVCFLVLF